MRALCHTVIGCESLTWSSLSIGVMVVTGIASFPVIGLMCFHVVLVCRGRTTNEQVRTLQRAGCICDTKWSINVL